MNLKTTTLSERSTYLNTYLYDSMYGKFYKMQAYSD